MIVTDAFNRAAEKAQALSGRARQQIADIQNDGDLTAEAKAARIKAIKEATNSQLTELHVSAEAGMVDELNGLRKKVFSPRVGSSATAADRIAAAASFRDAMDRASKAVESGRGLGDMLNRSLMTSDSIQARAVLAVAVELGDLETVDAFTAAHPDEQQTVHDFHNLNASLSDPQAKFHRYLQFGAV